jgi:L-ascorbate metabolism protein UlaG (beta-lactamase superfamily)
MKFLWRIIKTFIKAVLVLTIVAGLSIAAFMNFSPQFGENPTGEKLAKISQSAHYQGDGFVNEVETNMDMGFEKILETSQAYMDADYTDPEGPLPVRFGNTNEATSDTSAFLTWYGHSAFLLEMEGKKILIDPLLGDAAAPLSFMSPRYAYEAPINMEDLKEIDAVIISHDHYDHLDYPTIDKIKAEVGHFYVPLGLGSHLESWGVDPGDITELDWWESATLDSIEFTATPARHFSGRGFTRNQTFWNSYVIAGNHQKIYFSGDGGYADHFEEIGERLGPFDLALVECGQYNKNWAEIHLMPEESVQAAIDVRAKEMMPIHWGAFRLALHDWNDPILRSKAAAIAKGMGFVSPYIGQRFEVGAEGNWDDWWEE